MCFLPSASKMLGEAVGIEKPYDASIANNLFGESMGNSDYQKKPPPLEPIIERQPYKDPVTRAQLAGQYDTDRRRIIAGVATGTLGVPGRASTTRGVITVGGG